MPGHIMTVVSSQQSKQHIYNTSAREKSTEMREIILYYWVKNMLSQAACMRTFYNVRCAQSFSTMIILIATSTKSIYIQWEVKTVFQTTYWLLQ